tara:strand:+ start:8029 stop:8778 length:750 start_codon:yes stop_codon:yes gene_type:complete
VKIHSIILFLCSLFIQGDITLEELDYFRILSDSDSKSIIESGTNQCNKFFDKDNLSADYRGYENFFLCKFSKKRNRFYVYMLAVEKKDKVKLKDFCKDIIISWPEIADHMDEKFVTQRKQFLGGFYVDNLYDNKFLEFTNNYSEDQSIIHNEISRFIIENRKNFTDDNYSNNEIIKKEISKISKIYKKIIDQDITDLERIIKIQLDKIVRYKIFVNDTNVFKSYSCNWEPGKGIIPYVKLEKFSEFENS